MAEAPSRKPATNAQALCERARKVLQIEADAVQALVERVDDQFVAAVEALRVCTGRVVVTGMGKSGQICRKIAATLASTGTPALFLHPAEGAHGDLGVLTRDDVVLAISQSGETEELSRILPSLKRLGVPIIAFTGRPASTLAKASNVVLDTSVAEEACPLGLAPTSSTTATLALGDALAVALLDARGFRSEDFARLHPAGALGRKLLLRVEDLMVTGDDVPRVSDTTSMREAILEITGKKLGMTAVEDDAGELVGVITDGDLRRALQESGDLLARPAVEVMTAGPKTVSAGALAVEAIQIMESHKITSLFVLDEHGAHVVGAIHMHHLISAGLA